MGIIRLGIVWNAVRFASYANRHKRQMIFVLNAGLYLRLRVPEILYIGFFIEIGEGLMNES